MAAFSLFDLIISLLVLFGLALFFWLLINILLDVFRDPSLSGWAKALWTVLVIVLPLIGLCAYLVVRGGSMHERMQQRAADQDAVARERLEGPGPSRAEELQKLKRLHDQGVLTDDEFAAQKAWVLGS
ncbi:MAG: SHOCT domain-containing protein [Acidimicrobiia bacterium]|nr:SHOCT domain-containing protein [Acidimicrobiia bacterium]